MVVEIFDLIFNGMSNGFGYWWVGAVGLLIFLFAIISSLSGQSFFATSLFALALIFPGIVIGVVNSNIFAAVAIIILGVTFAWYFWKLISS